MSDGQRLPLAEASAIANELIALLSPFAVELFSNQKEIMIAGSVRREKDTIGDVEFAAMQSADLFTALDKMVADGVISKADYNGSSRWGDKYRGFMFRGLKCEIFTYDENNRGVVQWLRTGPGEGNTHVMTTLGRKRASYRLQGGYLWYAKKWSKDTRGDWTADDRELIPVWSEQQLFNLLGIKWLEPQERSEERYAKAFGHSDHYFGFKPHVCHLWTDRIDNIDPARIDTTAKSASTDEGKLLAPTWELVNAIKDGSITWEQYTDGYINLLRGRYPAHKELFEQILKRGKVIVECYCSKDDCLHCHRTLAVQVLKKIAWSSGLYVLDCGEVKEEIVQQRLFA